MARPTTIAFYLPQFYPIAENDSWYGKGFTEWRNVVTSAPLFDGHYQPRIPRDLGFYDLRVPEVREQQAALALSHGIDAFCYYHYWFDGHQPLRQIIDDILLHDTPAMPFCLAWANENWSRHWDASENEILLRQTYSEEDGVRHGEYLLQVLKHPRYLKVNGRPILFIYRAQALPDARGTLDRWRAMWREGGVGEVEIVTFDTHGATADPASYGADAAAQFLPHGVQTAVPAVRPDGCGEGNHVVEYDAVVDHYLAAEQPAWPRYECVLPAWDNSPRRGEGRSFLLHGSTPEGYARWLRGAVQRAGEDGIVLINAWNEWAEGAYLEPDLEFGDAYLRATADVLGASGDPGPGRPVPLSRVPFAVRDRFAELYLQAFDAQVTLQRRLSRLEATMERAVAAARSEAQAEVAHWKSVAQTLAERELGA